MNTPGYHGRYLKVDVSTGTALEVPISESALRDVIGGSGLGVSLLLSENPTHFEPLAPEAGIVFAFSPLVGSPLTTSAKFAVVSQSPLTHRINDSLAGSRFAIAGKRTGYDAIVLVGRADKLSMLIIDNGLVSIQPVEELVGMSNSDTQREIRHRLGNDFQVATIGLAGEQQVLFATISHDGRHAGRGGSGAVLGSKNIKAIAVRGNRTVQWFAPTGLVKYAKELSHRSFGPATEKYRELGTAANLLLFNRLHVLPTQNFQQGSFAGASAISPEQLSVERHKVQASCAACTIGCEHLYGVAANTASVRLEYETLFALGPMCGINQPEALLQAGRYCDQVGLDTISAGGTIAFAMECAQRHLIDVPWLRFGDPRALQACLELMVHYPHPNSVIALSKQWEMSVPSLVELGRLMAMGSRRMAEEIGQGAIEFAPQVKGLEMPGYDPRGLQMLALGLAVNARGADHNRSGAYEVDFSTAVDRRAAKPESVKLAVETEDKAALMDSLILCKFLRGVLTDFYQESSQMLQLVTGWDVSADELRSVARRIINSKKKFNILAGWTPSEDTLPERLLSQAIPEDQKAMLTRERLSSLVTAYNIARGWTPEGYLNEQSPHWNDA